jgi:serine/threonine protein kinase
MDDFEWVRTFANSSYGTISDEPLETAEKTGSAPPTTAATRGSFASFVCHVTRLQSKLRAFSPIVLDDSSTIKESGRTLGQGTTFIVRHAQWTRDADEPPLDVALKEIISDAESLEEASLNTSQRPRTDWKDILFEIRALLHEPLRYHPNIVSLLGIRWGLSPLSESAYPMLIMEYAPFGTFSSLQTSSEPLAFPVKQKLCYDVGRALLALHACGIVHGDLKHENVLIFPSKKPIDGVPYTAKLADFGGTVMDMKRGEVRKMETWTWPFQAPEITNGQKLSGEQMMLTDTYSFGLLVWRAFMDGEGFVSLPGAAQDAPDHERRELNATKGEKTLTALAMAHVYQYAAKRGISKSCVEMIVCTLYYTVQLNPEDRDLVKAQASLRGIRYEYLPFLWYHC